MKRIIAVDVGNSSAKFGVFDSHSLMNFPTPIKTWKHDPEQYRSVCSESDSIRWVFSCVHPDRLRELLDWIVRNRPTDSTHILKSVQVPIRANVDYPERVGTDRLLAALAAVRWKEQFLPAQQKTPLLVCDPGTAITVDWVSPDGVFQGGAIFPGLTLAAQSLRQGTAMLPEIRIENNGRDSDTWAYPGKNTEQAIRAGVFWGAVGAIRQFVDLVRTPSSEPILIMTGECSQVIFPALETTFQDGFLHWVPDLVLSGIALTPYAVE